MSPGSVSLALRLIAESVESSVRPSRSEVASDVREVLGALEAGGSFGARVALFDTLKKLKRKVFNTKGQRKTLEKIDRLKRLRKEAKPLAKEIRDGVNFADVATEDDWVEILKNAAKYMKGSKGLKELASARKAYEVTAALGEMDEFYQDRDDEDHADREAIVDAISDFVDAADTRIKELELRLEGQKSGGAPKFRREQEKEEAERERKEAKRGEKTQKEVERLEKKLSRD